MASTNDVSIVELECWIGDLLIVTTGSSRRFLGDGTVKGDKHNVDVGMGLAFARALKSLAAKVERQALGQSAHDENMRIQKLNAKPRPDHEIVFEDQVGNELVTYDVSEKEYKALKKEAKKAKVPFSEYINELVRKELLSSDSRV
jgi:predicted DNA binding CopG/RHH family protein